MNAEARNLIDLIHSSAARLEHILSNGHAKPVLPATSAPEPGSDAIDLTFATVTSIVESISPPTELQTCAVGTRLQYPLEACRRAQYHAKKPGLIRTLAATRSAVGNVLAKHGVRNCYKLTLSRQWITAERVR